MQIQKINSIEFNANLKCTPTLKNLYRTATPETKEAFLKVLNALEKSSDTLSFSFANSQAKRNGKNYFHIALLEEDTKEAGYKIARQVIELPEYYRDSKSACERNENLLEKFIKFFKTNYAEELKDNVISYETINKFYNS
jgi:hypothetical protein